MADSGRDWRAHQDKFSFNGPSQAETAFRCGNGVSEWLARAIVFQVLFRCPTMRSGRQVCWTLAGHRIKRLWVPGRPFERWQQATASANHHVLKIQQIAMRCIPDTFLV